MKKLTIVCALLWLAAAPSVFADFKLNEQTTIVFATVEQGRDVLGRQDDYTTRLSPFDLASKLRTDKPVTKDDYIAFVKENVLGWEPVEITAVQEALKAIQNGLAPLSRNLPAIIYLIKTTGLEEGNAAYTRSNAIVLPRSYVAVSTPERHNRVASNLQRPAAHELFHVLSRHNPELRKRLYAVIGFEPCNDVNYPPSLDRRRISNPDAPRNDYYIDLTLDNKPIAAVPVIFSRTEKYDAEAGDSFFQYLDFQLLLIEKDPNSGDYQPVIKGRSPLLTSSERVSGFFEKVGRNTNYIIHPEEILADNFALLVQGRKNVTSPEILEKMRAILTSEKENTAENVLEKPAPTGQAPQ